MPPVHRQNDLTTGHPPCYPPTRPETYSANVKANSRNVVRHSDVIIEHCCGGCHKGNYVGTNTVKVNGRYAQRVGHPISCGDTVATGSHNVNVN